jgi:hypothetical protein
MVVAALASCATATVAPPNSTTVPVIATTPGESAEGSVTTRTSREAEAVYSHDVLDWLADELTSLVAEVQGTGTLVGPSVRYNEPPCLWEALRAAPNQGVGFDVTTGTMRFFLEDRTERDESDRPRPEDDLSHPGWKPTEWAVAILLTFRDHTWVELPRDEMAGEVTKVEAASFYVEPVREPRHCHVIERFDVTERVRRLLPKAFTEGPAG